MQKTAIQEAAISEEKSNYFYIFLRKNIFIIIIQKYKKDYYHTQV